MHIVVKVKHGYIDEIIVPDSSVKVLVLDSDDPTNTETVLVDGDEAYLDAITISNQTVDAARIQKVLREFKNGLAELPETEEVRAVRAVLAPATTA